MGRGGKRQAQPGTYTPNRTDLQKGPTQPITTVPGQPYGEATQQQDQQRAIPLANGPGVPSVAPGVAPPGPPPTPIAGQMGQSLFDPTNRPSEPVTAGAASGPGPGPEALGGPTPAGTVTQTLAAIAKATGNPDIMALLQHAQAEGQ